MHRIARRPAQVALVLAALLFAGPAAAQYREFPGRIEAVDGANLTVSNRKGDNVTFARDEASQVRGRKSSWAGLARGDRVTVSWKMTDTPRRAWIVNVMPARPEDGGKE